MNYTKELFNEIEETFNSLDAQIGIYKRIIQGLVDEGDSFGFIEYEVKKHLNKYKETPIIPCDSEGGY